MTNDNDRFIHGFIATLFVSATVGILVTSYVSQALLGKDPVPYDASILGLFTTTIGIVAYYFGKSTTAAQAPKVFAAPPLHPIETKVPVTVEAAPVATVPVVEMPDVPAAPAAPEDFTHTEETEAHLAAS